MDVLGDFTQIMHSWIETWQRLTKIILNLLQRGSFFFINVCQFWEFRFTQICCAKEQEFMKGWFGKGWVFIACSYPKSHKVCFENSITYVLFWKIVNVCSLLSFCRLIASQILPGLVSAGVWHLKVQSQGRNPLKFQDGANWLKLVVLPFN